MENIFWSEDCHLKPRVVIDSLLLFWVQQKSDFLFLLQAFWASKLTLYWSWAILNRCYSSMDFTAFSLSRSFPVFIYEPERICVKHLKIVFFFFFACSTLQKSWSHNWMTFSVHQLHLYIAQIMLAYVKSYESVT